MDRTTAQQTIQKITNSNKKKSKINTSNFDKDTKVQATQVIQKLKLTNIIESPKEKDEATSKTQSTVEVTKNEQKLSDNSRNEKFVEIQVNGDSDLKSAEPIPDHPMNGATTRATPTPI